MEPLTKTLVLSAKVSPTGRLEFAVPDAFRDKTVEVQCTLKAQGEEPRDKYGWPIGFWDRVYGSIEDPSFERAPQGQMPPSPNFDE